jgi:hypothetical protein
LRLRLDVDTVVQATTPNSGPITIQGGGLLGFFFMAILCGARGNVVVDMMNDMASIMGMVNTAEYCAEGDEICYLEEDNKALMNCLES